jgi:hypothetical protein
MFPESLCRTNGINHEAVRRSIALKDFENAMIDPI